MNSIFTQIRRTGIRLGMVCFAAAIPLLAQTSEELKTAQTKLGHIWSGITANGDVGTFNFSTGFFPNDFDIVQYRGQTNDNFTGSGFKLACTNWHAPAGTFSVDSIYPVAIFGPKVSTTDFPNSAYVNGKVVVPLTNYIRYRYPVHSVDNKAVTVSDFGTVDPTKMTGGTYDQIAEVTTRNILGVEIHRKVMVWSQLYNDNYIINDVELTNVGTDTLKTFYLWTAQGMSNNFYSNGSNPTPPNSEAPKYGYLWQHYEGGRIGDTLRIFYYYSADDPGASGDNMGSPVVSQNGRLLNTNFTFYTILHASKEPYLSSVNDADDFDQPKVTYIGTETKIPNPDPSEDEFGSKSFWTLRGAFSDKNPMTGSVRPGTHHMLNNDEMGSADFSAYPGGDYSNNNQSRNMCSFGPYTFPPNHKLRIVYATGVAGIGLTASKEIGNKWLAETLDNPPNMPNPVTGWLPSNFVFPSGAREVDKRKDRWISMGIDSLRLSAWRAKWNFQHGYKVPQAPPPPDSLSIAGTGKGIEIRWLDPLAESSPRFTGYRILRRQSKYDTVLYSEIYSSTALDKASTHLYIDTGAVLGAPYYYIVQAKWIIDANDPNADPTTRGKVMLSSRALIPNMTSTTAPGYSQDDLSKIRIVPNPCNINDPVFKAQLYVEDRRINFFNVPAQATIKIFTENGDLVKTLVNESSIGAGLVPWDMITSSQQVISSGIYIAVFQKPGGEVAYQKFIVIR